MKAPSISCWLAVLAALSLACNAQTARRSRPLPDVIPDPHSDDPVAPVVEGTDGNARKYYTKTAKSLGLVADLKDDGQHDNEDFAKVSAELTLQRVLDYAGFANLKIIEALAQTPDELKKRFPSNALVSVRYFSPKISDVSGPPLNPNGARNVFSYGWRKIVRLRPQPGSGAAKAGARSILVLFNVFTEPDEQGKPTVGEKGDPFLDNDAANNQVIIVGPKPLTDPAARPDAPLYWFVFGSIKGGAPLQNFLTATFDARDPLIEEGAQTPIRKYHVPQACADCHGGLRDATPNTKFPSAKLNFVDTDHLYDRVQAGDDFHLLTQTKFPVLLDGGKIAADGGSAGAPSERFKEMFKDFRQINSEIRDQNAEVTDKPNQTFALRAVSKWLDVHREELADATAHRQMFSRALQEGSGEIWKEKNTVDAKLLPQLNRFCYRCHSSLRYSVFDKSMVLDNIRDKRLIQRLQPPATIPNGTPPMPQDRKLSVGQRDGLIKLLTELSAPP